MAGGDFYEFGPFGLEPQERRLSRSGRPVALTPKCFDLLLALVENSGHLLSKEELLDRVWPGQFVEESSLSFNISELRKVLGDDRDYIETVRKKGFRFMARVEKRDGVEPGSELDHIPPPFKERAAGIERSPAAAGVVDATASSVPSALSRRRSLGRGVVITLAAGSLAFSVYLLSMKAVSVSSGDPVRTIAVLPFKPLVSGARDESLELGMANTLIARLGGVTVVRPISTVRRYTDLEQEATAAGRELNVEAVLEGLIQRSGGRVRITARLLRVADGAQLWTGKFDEDFTDILSVQDSIAEQVARSLTLHLTGEQKRQLTRRETQSAEAYELYVKGRFFLNKRTGRELEKAVEHFRQALALDSHFALAYSGLGDAYALLSSLGGVPPEESFPLSKEAAERALSFDNTLAEAHTSLAFVREAFEWNFPEAESGYRRAVSLDPEYGTAHQRYGVFLVMMRRFDEGLAELERARQLDPTSLVINADIGLAYYFARRYDRCIEHLKKTAEMHPTSFRPPLNLVGCYVQKGMFDDAMAEAQKAFGLMVRTGPRTRAVLGYIHAAAGRKGEARAILQEWSTQSQQFAQPFSPAAAYAALGEKDKALELLALGYEQRAYMPRLGVDPALDNLRSDVRFRDLLKRIGFHD